MASDGVDGSTWMLGALLIVLYRCFVTFWIPELFPMAGAIYCSYPQVSLYICHILFHPLAAGCMLLLQNRSANRTISLCAVRKTVLVVAVHAGACG
jgi:hypothetical protein